MKALGAGRKVLVLSGRRGHLDDLARVVKLEMEKKEKRYTWGYYVGGMNDKERTIAATRQLILGTYQMAEEGLDIPGLDTLFLTTPKGNIEQAVGRILREVKEKKGPMVLDFVDDSLPMCPNLARKRMGLYRKLGYVE